MAYAVEFIVGDDDRPATQTLHPLPTVASQIILLQSIPQYSLILRAKAAIISLKIDFHEPSDKGRDLTRIKQRSPLVHSQALLVQNNAGTYGINPNKSSASFANLPYNGDITNCATAEFFFYFFRL